MPLSHLTLTVSHLPTSTSFFLSCLQPLGYQFIGRHDDYIGFGQKQGEPADFWITEQKPGVPAGAAHVAFPANSKDAVGTFFISALKAGGKIHGEPKMRDSESGYYSAAVIDFDGNSIEAVYRPSSSSARSEVKSVVKSEISRPALALLENGSVVSKASSRASSVRTESIAPPRSEARSEARSYVSKTNTTIERAAPAPSMVSRDHYQAPRDLQPAPSPTYIVHHTTHTTQKTDNDKTAKTIVGTLIGAAAGAALAYAIAKGDSTETTETNSAPPQFSPRDIAQLISPSQAPSQTQEYPNFKAIEAGPARSTYSARSDGRPTLTRSVTSKNPRASTIYEGTEFVPRGNGGSVYLDDNGRRASEGSVYSTRDIPIRAIEYGQPDSQSRGYESTLISSFPDKSRAMDRESVYSASTIKPSKASYQDSHHGSHRSSHSHHSTPRTIPAGSIASSTRSARQAPIPEGSAIGSFASHRSGAKSGVSAREVPLPESVIDLDVRTNVTPDDSISQVDDSRRSSYSHRSHASKAAGSRVSTHSSKFDEPVKPSDSVSQVSSNVSQRTMKAGGGGSVAPSKAASKISSRRGSSQVA
ncbi:VOC family protein [Aspergillus homomorphus CBS 101889]|uniref:Glyoxalase family protein n=1 Tax=Aspergillus homomorphus (strain CBS 101889) TaxID=1450537 RepID=A0A395HSQ0_ASPHC|nr:glyoxalase family protein [Aspergillus homomorphus CBS 101889]RAL10519.1 glyoxalase family protein [Aspergillus homomorphus CBS 101889]